MKRIFSALAILAAVLVLFMTIKGGDYRGIIIALCLIVLSALLTYSKKVAEIFSKLNRRYITLFLGVVSIIFAVFEYVSPSHPSDGSASLVARSLLAMGGSNLLIFVYSVVGIFLIIDSYRR